MRKLLAVVLLAFTVAGCITTGSVNNPITNTDVYRLKLGYKATGTLVEKWRGYCWARSYKSLLADPVAKPICQNRRATLRTIQSADDKTVEAIGRVDAFVKSNPTLSITSIIGPAWDALTKFQQAVPTVPF